MASERRPSPNQALDLLQTLLETPLSSPLPAARLAPNPPLHRPIAPLANPDAIALLQALLDMPIAPGNDRRPPVTLRAIDSRHGSRPARYAAPTRFDMLLHRSSQALSIGAVLVLGYWFVNVPLNNWMHPRRVPVVRALSVRPSATATRVAATRTTSLVSNAAPNAAQPSPQSDRAAPIRTSAVPSATSAEVQAMALGATSVEVQAATPRATQPITAGEQIVSPTALEVPPTDTPQPTASPPAPSPTEVFMWPTMTPVQLGIVTKPSPVAVQRDAVAGPAAAPAQANSAGALPTRLIIPTLGLDVPIKEVFIVDDQWEVAEYAAGYLNGSGRPGVPGNLALSGHAGLYGAVFANLGSLNPGDDIFVDAAGVRYHYRLRTASAFWPNQTEVLDSTETPTMTLITCTNWDTQRLVAQADYVDSSVVPDA